MKYKDIVNFTIINKLKSLLNNVCLTYNKIINPKNIKNRENEYYEVYTQQYSADMKNLQDLRDFCLQTADLCNKTLLMMNTYHIKQYYIDKEELSEYEFSEEYINQLPEEKIIEETKIETQISEPLNNDEEDIW